jgi:enoyl-CoA hydratase/carnithine racemase
MALTGDAISAETAAEWGFINSVVDDEQLDDAVLDLLARATKGSRESKALGKKTYYEQVQMNVPDAYDFASAVMADAAVSDVAQEGIRAFLEKRAPDFGDR